MSRSYFLLDDSKPRLSRRDFLATTSLAVAGATLPGCGTVNSHVHAEPIIDIHQHIGYLERSDEATLEHQRAMGVTTTILLPSGRPMKTA